MADARALLRASRSSRQSISHPLAQYTSTNQLTCKVCQVPIKSDSLWDAHVKSAQHVVRLEANKHAEQMAKAPRPSGKKRKADSDDEPDASGMNDGESKKRKKGSAEIEGRKRKELKREHVRARSSLAGGRDGAAAAAAAMAAPVSKVKANDGGSPDAAVESQLNEPSQTSDATPVTKGRGIHMDLSGPTNSTSKHSEKPAESISIDDATDDIENAEFAAFEAEIAALDSEQTPAKPAQSISRAGIAALAAPPTISSKATKASGELVPDEPSDERIAAKHDRKHKEQELEDEREDAAYAAEEEMERMADYDARVKKWRELREALRERDSQRGEGVVTGIEKSTAPEAQTDNANSDKKKTEDEPEEDDEDEDDEEGEEDMFGWAGRGL